MQLPLPGKDTPISLLQGECVLLGLSGIHLLSFPLVLESLPSSQIQRILEGPLISTFKIELKIQHDRVH